MNLIPVKNPHKDKIVFVEVTVGSSNQTTWMACITTGVNFEKFRAEVTQLANPDNCIWLNFNELFETS